MQHHIDALLDIWEKRPVKLADPVRLRFPLIEDIDHLREPCCFCGGDPKGLTACCADEAYEWDADATEALARPDEVDSLTMPTPNFRGDM